MKGIKPHHTLLFLGALLTQTAIAGTLTVTSTADDGGPGTFRAALASATDGDIIDLSSLTGAIALNGGQLVVERSVTILGPGPNQLTVDAQQASRAFLIAPGNTVMISGLTISNGFESYETGFGAGGGILNELATLTISNCVIAGCSAEMGGGGIFNDGGSLLVGEYSGAANLTLIDTTITGNTTEFGEGAGILNANFPGNPTALSLDRCTVSANTAAFGGGISSSGDVSVVIHNSTLSGNSAEFGPGGGLFVYAGSVLVLNSSTFSENISGIDLGDSLAASGATIALRNTILNTVPLRENFWVDPTEPSTVQSYGYNLSSDGGGGYLTAPGDLINTDPLLGPLQDNGGPTFTHALLEGSPALNAGAATDITGFPVTGDQRGVARPQGSGVDIGAFEFQPAPPEHIYSWSGVLRPINPDGSSVFKGGSTVPVKFTLTGDDASITDLVATLSYAKITGEVIGTINEAETKAVADAGNQFRYDAASGQYVFNWSAKGVGAGTYRLFINLGDGVERTVDLSLK